MADFEYSADVQSLAFEVSGLLGDFDDPDWVQPEASWKLVDLIDKMITERLRRVLS